jgi:hypothetical protein
MYKDLGLVNKMKGEIEVEAAILSTMVFEEELIEPLLEAKIPVSINSINIIDNSFLGKEQRCEWPSG